MKILVEKILSNINKVLTCYEKLHDYEEHGCTYDKIKKELILLKNTSEELIPLMKSLSKGNPTQIIGANTLFNIFKVNFLPTLKVHLLYLKETERLDKDLLKIQARLAITYLNVDGCIDNLRII
ncbi:MAG: hypothetical protein KGL95_09855, partial [Patescibacteria group bacterium]|nr:hypothetical protein [Patescibacteria group bacterium]